MGASPKQLNNPFCQTQNGQDKQNKLFQTFILTLCVSVNMRGVFIGKHRRNSYTFDFHANCLMESESLLILGRDRNDNGGQPSFYRI